MINTRLQSLVLQGLECEAAAEAHTLGKRIPLKKGNNQSVNAGCLPATTLASDVALDYERGDHRETRHNSETSSGYPGNRQRPPREEIKDHTPKASTGGILQGKKRIFPQVLAAFRRTGPTGGQCIGMYKDLAFSANLPAGVPCGTVTSSLYC